MLKVTGSIKRAFTFPADPATALAYYSDLSRLIHFLPHVSLIQIYNRRQLRVCYQSLELGAYTVCIFCDLESRVDFENRILTVSPMKSPTPVSSQANLNTTTGHGYFALETRFHDLGNQETRMEYTLQLAALLPRPRGLRLMPGRVVDRITASITDGRVREIADGFVRHSIKAFPSWLAENHTQI
jgi:hypothetical protein